MRVVQVSEVIKFCKEEDSIAPAIAMYAKGKAVKFCPRFVLPQQELWRKAISTVQRVFIIGLRVNIEDEHIWDVLASSKAELLYVGFEKEDFENWTKENKHNNSQWVANTFEEAFPEIKNYLKQSIPTPKRYLKF